MSWLYSQALVAEYLADTCSDGAPFAPSSVSPTPQAYCAPDKMTAFSRPSRFGMTFAPLTDDHGAALLTWYRVGFPAKTSAPPAKAQASTARAAGFGEKWRELSVKYDPATSSWKTHRCLWDEDLPESSLTLPKWGSMRAGVLSERMTSALPTAETGAGLWPTPTAQLAKHSTPTEWEKANRPRHLHVMAAMTWPTPTKSDGCGGPGHSGRAGGLNLRTAVMWPTPTVQDANQAGSPNAQHRTLHRVVKDLYTTPCADDTGHRKAKYAQGGTALSLQAGGQLNPTWVEWLMGWPLGWTDLKPLVTAKCRNAPPQPGACLVARTEML